MGGERYIKSGKNVNYGKEEMNAKRIVSRMRYTRRRSWGW